MFRNIALNAPSSVDPRRAEQLGSIRMPSDVSDHDGRRASFGLLRRTEEGRRRIVVVPRKRVDEGMGVAAVEGLDEETVEGPDLGDRSEEGGRS
jgi:hypothetical protein